MAASRRPVDSQADLEPPAVRALACCTRPLRALVPRFLELDLFDAHSALAVGGASTLFHLPYFLADIDAEDLRGCQSFRSRRRRGDGATFDGQYSPLVHCFNRAPAHSSTSSRNDTAFTPRIHRRACRVEIHHAPWELQPAEARISINTMVEAAALRLPSVAPLLRYARRREVLTWSPHRLP